GLNGLRASGALRQAPTTHAATPTTVRLDGADRPRHGAALVPEASERDRGLLLNGELRLERIGRDGGEGSDDLVCLPGRIVGDVLERVREVIAARVLAVGVGKERDHRITERLRASSPAPRIRLPGRPLAELIEP